MRHNVYGRKLGRNKNERTALFRNLVQSLFLEEKIVTSEAKAKAIKPTVDQLITQAKSPASSRLVNQFITAKKTQEKLVKELLPRLKSRSSGYTSVVRLGRRLGDDTSMVQMSLILDEITSGKIAPVVKAQKSGSQTTKVASEEISKKPARKTVISRRLNNGN